MADAITAPAPSGRKNKGALLSALCFNERIHAFDEHLSGQVALLPEGRRVVA